MFLSQTPPAVMSRWGDKTKKGSTVQLFYFVLKAKGQTIPDIEGQELADRAAARLHALTVARQLMRGREGQTHHWRIQVCDDYLRPLFDVFFAEACDSLECHPQLQQSIGQAARTAAGFSDAVDEMRATLNDISETLARADQVLAAIPGIRR